MTILNSKRKLLTCVLVAVLNLILILGFRIVIQNKMTFVSMPENQTGMTTDSFSAGDEIVQTFFGCIEGIDRLELCFSDESCDATILLSVYNNATSQYYYQTETVVTGKQMLILLDRPIDDSKGHEFYLKIQPLDAEHEVSLILADAPYPDNHLLINDAEISSDIAMVQYADSSVKDYWSKTAVGLIVMDALLAAAFLSKRRFMVGTDSKIEQQDAVLNLIKLVACTGVLVSHLADHVAYQGPWYQLLLTGSWFPMTFYVVSGFTNVPAYERTHKLSIYYLKRAFRILPIYYCVIAVMFAYTRLTHYPVPSDEYGLGWLQYVFLLSTTLPNSEDFWVNLCATWTVPFFAAFYLLMPAMVKWMNRYKKALFGTIILAFSSLEIAYYAFPKLQSFGVQNAGIMPVVFPLQMLYIFAMGMTAWYAVEENKHINYVLLNCTIMYLSYISDVDKLFAIPLACLSTVFVVYSRKIKIGMPFLRKAINRAAQYSYALYLVHPVILFIDGDRGGRHLFGGATGFYLIWLCALILVAVYIAHNTVELYADKLCKEICQKIDKNAKEKDTGQARH